MPLSLLRVLEENGLLEDVDMRPLQQAIGGAPNQLPRLIRRYPRRYAVMPKAWWLYLPSSPPEVPLKKRIKPGAISNKKLGQN